MNYQRSLFLAFIFFIQAQLAFGQVACDNNIGNYTRNSTYSANLNTTLSSLSNNIDNSGFYNVSVGQGIDRAHGMALCRVDIQLNTLHEWVQKATTEILILCPNQKQATIYNEFCIVRFSNVTMYGVLDALPGSYVLINQNVSSPEQFKDDLRRLLDNLRNQAASGGSLRKVAAGNISGPDFQTIFALVQCTPDLSPDDCSSCLSAVALHIPRCCDGKIMGRIQAPSCNLRFEINPFYNKTRLQELESAPAPVPVPVTEQPSQSPPGKDDDNTTRTVIIIVVSIVVCLILAVSAIILLRKRRKQKLMENPETVEEISAAESLQHAFSTIKAATNDFSDDNKLGQGGFGAVYKGKLPNGQEIAVKRLSRDSGQGDLEFKNEVLLLAKLQHRNLVRLLGFALEGLEKLLVYEFIQNASLDHFIFDPIKHSFLNWDRRYKIILGVARGILYLHEDSRLRIIHRDLKASNILLDREMNPKIADFGMARLFGQDETRRNTSRVVGTYGYMPPEYLMHGQFSIKSDVFSFGVLVLEIISGRKVNGFGDGENAEYLLSSAWKNWRDGTIGNVVDPFLMSRSGASGSIKDMLRCIHIGLLCVQENAVDRPAMASVVLMLSSFSMTMAVPSEPAFYFPSGYGPDVSRLHQYNNLSNSNVQSDHSSRNDASITDMYPR